MTRFWFTQPTGQQQCPDLQPFVRINLSVAREPVMFIMYSHYLAQYPYPVPKSRSHQIQKSGNAGITQTVLQFLILQAPICVGVYSSMLFHHMWRWYNHYHNQDTVLFHDHKDPLGNPFTVTLLNNPIPNAFICSFSLYFYHFKNAVKMES